jgi:hypothetical protein
MSRRLWAPVLQAAVILLTLGALPAAASPIVTFNQPPGSAAGFAFATTVSDFTTPYTLAGAGTATAVLGAPDGSFDPNTPQFVDFGGGDLSVPWTVTVGFGTTFGDVAGVDIRVYTTQLNSTEGWDLFASADGVAFSPIATFVAFNAGNPDRAAIDIDLNGTALPVGARYLRFVGTQVPVSNFAFGFDFDAVGVTAVASAPAAVPEPATLLLLSSGLAMATRRRAAAHRR